jgi:hypothetical protein
MNSQAAADLINTKTDSPPPLRYENGDVIVKLNLHPKDWLLLNADVIRTTMPTLVPSLKSTWYKPMEITRPDAPATEPPAEVYMLALHYSQKDQTYVLENCRVSYHSHHQIIVTIC